VGFLCIIAAVLLLPALIYSPHDAAFNVSRQVSTVAQCAFRRWRIPRCSRVFFDLAHADAVGGMARNRVGAVSSAGGYALRACLSPADRGRGAAFAPGLSAPAAARGACWGHAGACSFICSRQKHFASLRLGHSPKIRWRGGRLGIAEAQARGGGAGESSGMRRRVGIAAFGEKPVHRKPSAGERGMVLRVVNVMGVRERDRVEEGGRKGGKRRKRVVFNRSWKSSAAD
jgi:hypothetical protein